MDGRYIPAIIGLINGASHGETRPSLSRAGAFSVLYSFNFAVPDFDPAGQFEAFITRRSREAA
jgi:hypothetical protein